MGFTKNIYFLGLIIIVAYVIFFGFTLWHSFDKDSSNNGTKLIITKSSCCNGSSQIIILHDNNDNPFSGLEKISATFGAIVAGVVGYYFGQRQSESSENRANESEKDLRKAIDILEKKQSEEESRKAVENENLRKLLEQMNSNEMKDIE